MCFFDNRNAVIQFLQPGAFFNLSKPDLVTDYQSRESVMKPHFSLCSLAFCGQLNRMPPSLRWGLRT
jgi:hypothetical protein